MSALPATVAPLVGADWLMERIDVPELVLLDVRVTREFPPGGVKRYVGAPERYEVDGHLPGARFVDLIGGLSDPASGLNFTLPSAERLVEAFAALGVGRQSTVIAYDDDTGVWAARVWWLLRSLGHDRAAVLNGGLAAWVRAGGELAHGRSSRAVRGDLRAEREPGRFTGHDEVKALAGSADAGRLVCALDHAVFTGERSSGAGREGHIPGSVSLAYTTLLDEHGELQPSRVDRALAEAGLDAEAPLVTYCGGGITACGLALALTAAGHPEVSVYDGSLQEWAADDSTALATGEA